MPNHNALEVGQPRVGFLADGDPNTPPIPAQLLRTKEGIEVRVPWLETDPSDRTVERWFSGNALWADDPDKTRYRYEPPTTLEFADAHGRVVLVECRSHGAHRTFGMAGEGLIGVGYALPGATAAYRYTTINGVRSQIDGLGRWFNSPTVRTTPVIDDDSRIRAVDVHAEAPPATRVARELNLSLYPDFRLRTGDSPDDTVISERMLVQTLVSRARPWADHFAHHIAVRDLLRVASWRDLDFLSHEATRDDDPHRLMTGASLGRRWHRVETGRIGEGRTPQHRLGLPFLFTWDDVGAAGLRRWIALRRDLGRAVEPIVGLLALRGARIEAHWSQLGIGLEALGYLLARRSGLSRRRADNLAFVERLEYVRDSLTLPTGFDTATWAVSARTHYRAVKHADRALPSAEELVETYWCGVQLFRVWIAGRLGVSAAGFDGRFALDPVARRI